MDSKQMVALRPMRYARRDLTAGEPFAAPQVDADYLVRCKRARLADPVVVSHSEPASHATPAPAAAYSRSRGRQTQPRAPQATADRADTGAEQGADE